MTIQLYEESNSRMLVVQFLKEPDSISVEIQKGVVYHYNQSLMLTQMQVEDPAMIDQILSELKNLLDNPEIKIIRKIA